MECRGDGSEDQVRMFQFGDWSGLALPELEPVRRCSPLANLPKRRPVTFSFKP